MTTFADLRPLTADLPPIVLLSSLDFGGAGIAARRLLEGLIAAGADARMICLQKKSKWLPVGELKHPQSGAPLWNHDAALRREMMQNYPKRPAGLEIFSLTKSLVNLAEFDLVKNAPLIHLHWVAGLVGFPQAREILQNKFVVWTLHDMNPFTGGCHYSADCEKWKTAGCHECPQLGVPSPTIDYDLAAANFVNKYDGYNGLNLTVVTPSQWLGDCAKASLLMRTFPQRTIPYGFSLDDFSPQQPDNAKYRLGLPDDRKIILFGADDANNHRKGLQFLIAALEKLRTENGVKPLLAVFGMPPRGLPSGYECKVLGRLETPQQLATAYSAAEVFVLPSLEDNLPNTLIEAQACGALGIGFAIGGIPDIIQDGVTGFLAEKANVADLAAKIRTLLNLPSAEYEKMRENCRAHALAAYAPELQVERYLRLYRRLLNLPETPSATASGASIMAQPAAAPIADYDYISPELKPFNPEFAFPNLIIGDKKILSWQWSRKNLPHHHYVDRRIPDCGFLNRDEATLLYNAALPFANQPALEIGCFMGWSACHLASAGVALDVVDPLLARDLFAQSVNASLTAAGVRERVNLRAGLSPQAVENLAANGKRWKFIFIDGNHEAPGPMQDAEVCEKYAAADALIMFHDVNAPAVAAGVDYLRQRGWSIKIYHTTQIMAAAWRGNVAAPAHTPDPQIQWEIPAQLQFLAAYFEPAPLHSGSPAMEPAVHQIQNHLQDDESRYIFAERLAYMLDRNLAHFDNIVKRSLANRLTENGKVDVLRNAKELIGYTPNLGYCMADLFTKFRAYLTETLGVKFTHICVSEIPPSTLKIADYAKLLADGIKFITLEELVREHRDAFIALFSNFSDARKTLDYLLAQGFQRRQFFPLLGKASPYLDESFLGKQYFDLPEIKPDANEVFIDGGSFDGGTLADFVTFTNGKYRKIYAFEPIAAQYENVCKNIADWGIERTEIINKGLWSRDTVLSFKEGAAGSRACADGKLQIPVTTIDSVVGTERVTFIKLDVETAEMEALKGAAATICRDKPRLAVSIYHLPTDVVNLPAYILSLVPEYRLFIRHYHYNNWETVLYAVMPETIASTPEKPESAVSSQFHPCEPAQPKVSVVTLVYDGAEKYLRRCLHSIVNQTLREIEIICTNNCSLDSPALAILREYAAQDARIKVVSFPGNSSTVAFNTGMDLAQGEYIGSVDADDYIELDFYEKLYTAAHRENAEVVKGNFTTTNLAGQQIPNRLNACVKNNKMHLVGSIWQSIYKNAFLHEHHISCPEGLIDGCFTTQVACLVKKLAVVDDAYYRYIKCEQPLFRVHAKVSGYIKSDLWIVDYLNAATIDAASYLIAFRERIHIHYVLNDYQPDEPYRQKNLDAIRELYQKCKYKNLLTADELAVMNGTAICKKATSQESNLSAGAQFYADEIAKIIAAAKKYETEWRENPPAPTSREALTDIYVQPTIFDRSGNVLIKTVNGQKTYYRGIVADKADDFRQIYHCGALTALADAGRLVRVNLTNYYTEEFPLIFELETLRIVSSAYWSFSMLREAAVNMLIVNSVLQHYGYGVWDGHCGNTTFMRNRPVFFDVGSLVKGGSRCFLDEILSYVLVPLMMLATGKSHFARSAASYVAPRILPASIGRKESAEIQTLFSLFVQHHAQHSAADYNTVLREVFQQGKLNPEYIDFLFPYRPTAKTAWGDYQNKTNAQTAPDERYIRILELIKQFSPDAQTCVDIAGNAGAVAHLLAATGQFSSIINLDYDENAIESGRSQIKTGVVDFYLTNAMVADGNMPLVDFTAAVRSDLVLAMAVTHHLLLTQCYNIHAVLAIIAMYTRKYAYVEFCPLGMYSSAYPDRLPQVPAGYNNDWFAKNFAKTFKLLHREVIARVTVAGRELDHRILYIGEKIARN